MSKSFEIIERVGISNDSASDAINKVVMEAHSEGGVSWFEVVEQRGRVTHEDKIEFQVTVKIGKKINWCWFCKNSLKQKPDIKMIQKIINYILV